MQIDRRSFLFTAAVPFYAPAPFTALNVEEAKLVEAIVALVIPSDDAPGAREAGVIYYIDRQLSGPLKRYLAAYQNGVRAFNETCSEKMGALFLDLPAARQIAFLTDIDEGRIPQLRSFFQMIVDQTMQGFYGSPAHGGNRDEASWKMLDVVDVMEGHRH